MCHVLIIEDEALVALDIQFAVEEAGCASFAFARTEQEAVEEARRRPPGMIISDVHLAEGLGPRAVAQIHDEHGVIPVIFITGTPEDCLDCPADRVLSKPLHPAQFGALFRQLAPI